jgi:hypothetical protein
MEIIAGAVVVSAVCVAAGFVTLKGAGAAAQVMTQMFTSPANLGWPSGVQEDDDFHWRWSGPSAAPLKTEPEMVDLRDGSGPRAVPIARH